MVELDAVKPQLRLESEITRFAFENDAKHNLLILYYAGHGIYNHKEDILYLAAYVDLYHDAPIGSQLTFRDLVPTSSRSPEVSCQECLGMKQLGH